MKTETTTVATEKKARVARKAQSASKAPTLKLTVPANRPTSGAYLFAYTAACMSIVRKAPKAKQAAIAKLLHGARAMAYHGATGTKKIVPQQDGAVAYDAGYFAVGAKSLDEKRRAIPEAWVDAFAEYIRTGTIAKAPQDFAWKPVDKPLAVITVGAK